MRQFLVVVPAALLAVGCAHTKPAEPPASPPPPAAAAAKVEPAPAARSCSADRDCGPAQLCVRGTCVDISLGLAECQMFRVQFSFNGADIDPASKPDMERMSRCLRADQRLAVTISGNADERGTEEYNLQLGGRRASSVEKYLLALGATPAQVNTISYGENMPLCTEQDEACWAKNRRASVKPEVKPEAKAKGAKKP